MQARNRGFPPEDRLGGGQVPQGVAYALEEVVPEPFGGAKDLPQRRGLFPGKGVGLLGSEQVPRLLPFAPSRMSTTTVERETRAVGSSAVSGSKKPTAVTKRPSVALSGSTGCRLVVAVTKRPTL